LLIAVGVGCYFWFDHLETEGGRIRIHALILLLYNLLGKWGVLGVIGGIGVLMTVSGARGLMAGRPVPEGQAPEAEQEA
jgi:hypothetical protein